MPPTATSAINGKPQTASPLWELPVLPLRLRPGDEGDEGAELGPDGASGTIGASGSGAGGGAGAREGVLTSVARGTRAGILT